MPLDTKGQIHLNLSYVIINFRFHCDSPSASFLDILDQCSTIIQGEIHHRRKIDTFPSSHSSLTGPEYNTATRQLAF